MAIKYSAVSVNVSELRAFVQSRTSKKRTSATGLFRLEGEISEDYRLLHGYLKRYSAPHGSLIFNTFPRSYCISILVHPLNCRNYTFRNRRISKRRKQDVLRYSAAGNSKRFPLKTKIEYCDDLKRRKCSDKEIRVRINVLKVKLSP
jgi:hypothetical protein